MDNLKIYNSIYSELFGDEVPEEDYGELCYGDSGWDSVINMDILGMMEQEFNISISPVDKMSFASYQKGIEILKNYGISM